MRKSLHTTLALLGVCFALLIWFFGYEKNYRVKKEVSTEKAKQIVSLEKDDIRELEVERLVNPLTEGTLYPADFKPQYEVIKLRNSGGEWNLIHPIQDAADSNIVSSMLGSLTSTKQDRVVDENPKSLNDFGLAFPVVKIRARKDASSQAEEIWIGMNTPVGFNAYAKTANQNAVYRIGRGLRTSFDKTLKDVRSKTILSVARLDISEVEISGANIRGTAVLKKDPKKDEWQLASENIAADTAEWNKTLNTVLDAKATDFPPVDKGLAAYGLDKPVRTVTIAKNDKSKVSILVGRVKKKENGKDTEKVYVKKSDKDTVYEVDKELLVKLERPIESYRSLNIAKFNRYDVTQVKFERATDPIDLKKTDGRWGFVGETANINATKLDSLLTRLQDLKMEKYLSEHTPKLTAQNTVLTIRISELKRETAKDTETEVVTLKFGKAKDKLVTVERADLPIPFLIKESDFQTINLKKAEFIEAEKKPETKKEEPVKKS